MTNGRLRDLKKAASWRSLILEQGCSGMSVRAWCRDHGVSEASLYWWRRILGQRDAERQPSGQPVERSTRRDRRVKASVDPELAQPGETPPVFLPVCVADDGPEDASGRIEIILSDGRCVRLAGSVDRQMLSDVLAVLEHASC